MMYQNQISLYYWIYAEYFSWNIGLFICRLGRAGLAARTDRIFVYFNNHPWGQAVKNAEMMVQLLKHQGQI